MPKKNQDRSDYSAKLQDIRHHADLAEKAEREASDAHWRLAESVAEALALEGVTQRGLAHDLGWSEKYVRDLKTVWERFGDEGLRVDTFSFRDHLSLVNKSKDKAEEIVQVARANNLPYPEASKACQPSPTKQPASKLPPKRSVTLSLCESCAPQFETAASS